MVFVTTLWVAGFVTGKLVDERWMLNWKGFGRKLSWPYRMVHGQWRRVAYKFDNERKNLPWRCRRYFNSECWYVFTELRDFMWSSGLQPGVGEPPRVLEDLLRGTRKHL
jgi:hypothetical protein